MGKNILILGAGQYGYVVREAVEATGVFDRIETLDDNRDNVYGKISDLEKYIGDFNCVIVAIGNNEMRYNLLERAQNAGYEIPCIIHPRAFVSPSAKLGAGSIVEPFAVVQANADIGKGCIISATAVVNHNASIGNGVHCDCASIISARAVVPDFYKVKNGEVFYASVPDDDEKRYRGYTAEDGM